MPVVPMGAAGAVGVVYDIPGHELPPNAWTAGQNVRFIDGRAEKFTGQSGIFGTPAISSIWGLPYYNTNGIPGWLYAGTAKVYCYENGVEYNITRTTGGDYSAVASSRWSGGVLGGVPFVNNGVDVPQMWATPLGTNALAALSNWPASTTAKVLRPFKQFMVALDVTKTGVRYPTLVKWSHPADPGAVPSSWDHTDPTKDAGEYPLSETMGYAVDCLPLRDVNIVYKEDSVWAMQYVGGEFIFRFSKLFTTFGMPSKDCAVEFAAGRHLVFTGSDLVVLDGQQAESILDTKMKKALLDISYDNFKYSFMVAAPAQREVWFCWRDIGNAGSPTKALVWNWRTGTFGLRTLQDFAFIGVGRVDATVYAGADSWSVDSTPWEDDSTTWGDTALSIVGQSLVSFGTTINRLNTGESFNGTSMPSYLSRTGIGIPFKTDKPPDISSWKFCRQVWLNMTGTLGGVVTVTLGQQAVVGGDVTWESPIDFRIGMDTKVDCRLSGRTFAIRIESSAEIAWQLHSYDLDVDVLGTL